MYPSFETMMAAFDVRRNLLWVVGCTLFECFTVHTAMFHNHHPQRQCLGMPIPANVCKTVARLSYTRRVPQLRTTLAAIPLPAAVCDPDDGMLAVTMVSADLRGHAVHQVVRGLFDYYDRCGRAGVPRRL